LPIKQLKQNDEESPMHSRIIELINSHHRMQRISCNLQKSLEDSKRIPWKDKMRDVIAAQMKYDAQEFETALLFLHILEVERGVFDNFVTQLNIGFVAWEEMLDAYVGKGISAFIKSAEAITQKMYTDLNSLIKTNSKFHYLLGKLFEAYSVLRRKKLEIDGMIQDIPALSAEAEEIHRKLSERAVIIQAASLNSINTNMAFIESCAQERLGEIVIAYRLGVKRIFETYVELAKLSRNSERYLEPIKSAKSPAVNKKYPHDIYRLTQEMTPTPVRLKEKKQGRRADNELSPSSPLGKSSANSIRLALEDEFTPIMPNQPLLTWLNKDKDPKMGGEAQVLNIGKQFSLR
jgi:hypothetical protein